MDNLDKKKIHINPDFLSKRGETQLQSRVHVNPAFIAKSRGYKEMLQPTSFCTAATGLNPSLENVNAQTHISVTPVSLQVQSSNDFAAYHPLAMNEHYNSSQFGNTSFCTSVSNSLNIQKMNFCISKSQQLSPRKSNTTTSYYTQPWHYQSNINSGKPPPYSWKASEPSLPNKLVFSTASNASRALKLVDSSMSFRSSRFKYQCQNSVFNNKSLVSGNHISKYSGNKFKIDNRKHGSVVNRSLSPAKQIQSNSSKKNENLEVSNDKKLLDIKVREQSNPVLSVPTKSTVGEYINIGTGKHVNNLQNAIPRVEGVTFESLENKSMTKNSKDDLKKVRVDSQNIMPKYKIVSRTKLVRRRSKSFSKDKTKVNLSNGKLLQSGSPGHPRSVTVCRPSPKFPTRSHYHWGKIHPKRRYTVLSRTKLIRRLSCSSATEDDLNDIAHYTVKTKTKLIKKLPDSSMNKADADKKYAVLSSTKLIRKEPVFLDSGCKSQNKGSRQEVEVVIRRHKLVRNAKVKTGVKQGCERLGPKSFIGASSLYKIVNKSTGLSVKQKAARGIVSKYRINRLKSEVPAAVKRLDTARGVVSKYRINRLRAGSSVFKKQIIGDTSKYRLNRHTAEMAAVKRQKAARGIVSKYRINRLKSVQGIISKYRINRLRPVPAAVLKTSLGRFKWISSKGILQHSYSSQKRGSERFSDRIINIGGILYKATPTSLKKQLTKKRQMLKESDGSKCIVKLHGYQYYLSASGKTLTRIKSESSSVSAPPLSRVHIGGLTYSRTKAGQYELTKAHQARAVLSSAKQRSMVLLAQRRKRGTLQKRNQYCIFFNRFGRCTKKDKGECPYLHDPKRVAICTRFLRGRCPVDNCPFSHEIDPSKMPVCSHFVRSTCTREKCPYRHVKVSANAPFCLDFLNGYCPLGEECKKQHLLECEEFSVSGKCPRGESCPLSHRKGARKKRKSLSLEPVSSPNGKIIACRQPRKRKTSEPQDVLGGPSVKKEKIPKFKKSSAVRKRYFHVNETDGDGKKCIPAEENVSKIPVSTAKQSISDGKYQVSLENTDCSNAVSSLSDERDLPTSEVATEPCLANSNSENAMDLAKVRERVLQKVEKLKRAYNYQEGSDFSFIQNTDKNENALISIGSNKTVDGSETECNHKIEFEGCVSESQEANTEHAIYTYERRPLPKRLPSYIPLSSDSKELEDL